MKLSTLIEETVAPHRDFGVAIKVRLAVAATREPVGARNPASSMASAHPRKCRRFRPSDRRGGTRGWKTETIEIVISDDGRACPDMLKRSGTLFIAPPQRRRAQSGRSGLGLGVFIARTLPSLDGTFCSDGDLHHGAVIAVVLGPAHVPLEGAWRAMKTPRPSRYAALGLVCAAAAR